MMKQMKSQSILISGFALPLALVLVVIFFTIIGSILFSARIYNQHLLDNIQKLKLKNKAQINLEVYVSNNRNSCPTSNEPTITPIPICRYCFSNIGEFVKIVVVKPLPDNANLGKITSCACSQKGVLATASAEYICNSNSIEIKSFN